MVKFDCVSIAYSKLEILHQISTEFQNGKITTVIGPNGCGKSTLLHSLIGTSKVTDGKIWVDETDLFSLPPKERAKKIAFLPQVRGTIPTLPVHLLVEHGRFPYMGFGRKQSEEDRRIVKQAMEFAHVSQYANERVDTLSGGIRQRVFFAMILAQNSNYIVLDEPTTFLDLKGQREFLEMVLQLKHQKKTVVMVLHDIQQALQVSDEIIVMNQRKVIFQGTPQTCISSGIIEKTFDVTCQKFENNKKKYYFFQ